MAGIDHEKSMYQQSQLDQLFERYVLGKTTGIENERIEIFLSMMKELGQIHIEEEYEEALFTLLSASDFKRSNVEFFVKACGSESFSEEDALDVIKKWRARI